MTDRRADDLRAAVRAAGRGCAEAGVASPERDAVALAAHVLRSPPSRTSGTAMVLRRRGAGPAAYDALVERTRRPGARCSTSPGGRRSAGSSSAVGPGVFVPRPETEFVGRAGHRRGARPGAAPLVVDLCTGSGAIALAVADEVPGRDRVCRGAGSRRARLGGAQRRRLRARRRPAARRRDDAFPELDGTVDVVVATRRTSRSAWCRSTPRSATTTRSSRSTAAATTVWPSRWRSPPAPRAAAARWGARHGARRQPGRVAAARAGRTGRWVEVRDHDDLTGRPRATVAVRA